LIDYLDVKHIVLDLEATEKDEALQRVTEVLGQNGVIPDQDEFLQEMLKRENQGTTAIGDGIAIPHARCRSLPRIFLSVVRLKEGIQFGAEDRQPVRLLFLIGTPLDSAGEYLKALGRLSKLLRDHETGKKVLAARTSAEVITIIDEADRNL